MKYVALIALALALTACKIDLRQMPGGGNKDAPVEEPVSE